MLVTLNDLSAFFFFFCAIYTVLRNLRITLLHLCFHFLPQILTLSVKKKKKKVGKLQGKTNGCSWKRVQCSHHVFFYVDFLEKQSRKESSVTQVQPYSCLLLSLFICSSIQRCSHIVTVFAESVKQM